MEFLDVVVPTVSAMSISAMSFVATSRTTVCDIMCTTNTEIARHSKSEKKGFKSLPYSPVVKFPYQPDIRIVSGSRGKTNVDKYILAGHQSKRNEKLKRERVEFFKKVQEEKNNKLKLERDCVIRIQACYRGYRVRRPTSYRKKEKKCANMKSTRNFNELQEELCTLAEGLDLKPIPGLSLENRGKKSRRRARLELAAAIRIQSFVRMSLAVLSTTRQLERIRRTRMERAAAVLQRFFKWVRKQTAIAILEAQAEERAIVKIQTRIRIYAAKNRYVMYIICIYIMLLL